MAHAQTSEWEENGFIYIRGGGQFGDTAFKAELAVPKFDEVARFETDHTSGSGGLLDLGAGLRLVGNLGFGLGFSLMENQENITGTGAVPNPLFFGFLAQMHARFSPQQVVHAGGRGRGCARGRYSAGQSSVAQSTAACAAPLLVGGLLGGSQLDRKVLRRWYLQGDEP